MSEMQYVDPSASIGDATQVGHFCVILADVRIGSRCVIGHGVVIYPGSVIGDGVRVDDGAVIGKQPMRAANSAVTRGKAEPPPRIGDESIVGTYAVIYAGAQVGKRVLIADLATIREDVVIGDCSIIGRGAAVENACRLGRYCKVETNAYITAYSVLEDRVFVAPGVITGNDNYVGRTEERFKHFKGITVARGGRIGANATILPGLKIGADALVAAGSVVTRDAPAGRIVMGSPARDRRDVPAEQLLKNQNWPD